MPDPRSPPPGLGRPDPSRVPTRRGRPSARRPAAAGRVEAEVGSGPAPDEPGPGPTEPAAVGPAGATTGATVGLAGSASGASEPALPLVEPDDPASRTFKSLPPPTKDMSRERLAEVYGPYVRSIAGKVKKTLSKDIEFDDLFGYGMLGLMEAADRFDAKYGANFMTFAYYRVRGAIYDGLRGMGWVSRTEYQRYRVEQHANEYLRNVAEQEAVGGRVRKSEDEEVSEVADAVEGLITIFVTALDAMEGFQIADESTPSADASLEAQQARRLVAEAVEKLPEQERTLLTLYYYEERSLEEVGKHLGLSKSWTSRLHARAIEKLGRLLRELVEAYGDERPLVPRKKPGGRKPAQLAGSPGR